MARPKKNYNINIPTNWDEVSLNKFIQLQALYKDGNKPQYNDIISVLTDIAKEELNEYPAIVIEKVTDKLQFLSETITDKSSNKIEIDNVTYQINYLEDLKFGEYVDVNTVLDADKSNFPAILGILCRKEGEIYNDEYIARELTKRIEMFGKQPVSKVYPIINFFLSLSLTSENNMKPFLENLKDQANRIVTHYINSLKNGDGRSVCLNWRMRKLKRLLKSLKNI